MRRHGSESLWAQVKRIHRRSNPGAARYVTREAYWTWRGAASKTFALRWVVAQCMKEERLGPWAAYKLVRRWTILHGHWPAPVRRPGRKYIKRPRIRKARVTSNALLIDSKESE
jgi:hypothetical protein